MFIAGQAFPKQRKGLRGQTDQNAASSAVEMSVLWIVHTIDFIIIDSVLSLNFSDDAVHFECL
jgi:hypothetical protein